VATVGVAKGGVSMFTKMIVRRCQDIAQSVGSAMRMTMARAFSSHLGAAQMKSPIITSSLEKHSASVIFLHGSGKF